MLYDIGTQIKPIIHIPDLLIADFIDSLHKLPPLDTEKNRELCMCVCVYIYEHINKYIGMLERSEGAST